MIFKLTISQLGLVIRKATEPNPDATVITELSDDALIIKVKAGAKFYKPTSELYFNLTHDEGYIMLSLNDDKTKIAWLHKSSQGKIMNLVVDLVTKSGGVTIA